MTDAQRAALKPGDTVLVRAVVTQGRLDLFGAGPARRAACFFPRLYMGCCCRERTNALRRTTK